ncbi:ABC transporter permease [Virgibacillus sp. LDC1]|uniref:ABC transporter permease n=1 Tax=Paenibacillus TaxID=44249 RepID=UPI000C26E87F|nr:MULTISPECIES: ABC transporter permease [Paenibacillus]MCV4234715.1 ABC transporter permease [Virgibacillus sp. LDC1]MEC0259293.1 ABC transporter permease [Paenibacillus lautus]MEC0305478.1 ABC transporter permease [Paenibacillus lautus]PJN50412.1 Glutathione transport system permease protein GsiC [Paenibacillus sp. GM2FR]
MGGTEAARPNRLIGLISSTYSKILLNPSYRYLLLLLGAPVNLVVFLFYLVQRKKDDYTAAENRIRSEMLAAGYLEALRSEMMEQQKRKHDFFKQKVNEGQLRQEVDKIVEARFQEVLKERTAKELKLNNRKRLTMADTFGSLIENPLFFIISLIPGLLMYILIFLYSNPYLKYILERLVMTVFVIFGVAVLVFTILHLSPFNPAANILGETATPEQIAAFNKMHGLDQGYLTQLWNNIKGIAYFDLGKSFSGNEEITSSIARKFPITLTLTVISLIIAIVIALPIGIISATRPNSFFDYTFMFIALIGLSIPNFWQGLIFILNFSIKLQWLPATFNPENWLSMIMPVIVLGTGLTASVARMTRSSTLEVINEDYMITARAKGLSKGTILMKHAVRNAIIPIITVIGLQFGGMLGGSAVTEKVFNISGIGSYIVDKQFIPDIPAIMGGVVYTAITISLVNVIIDILYAFFDPRIRSKMKQY